MSPLLLCLFALVAAAPDPPRPPAALKISPRPCTIETKIGTCMFVWECIKSDGRHLGMCVDGFMFGSCCAHDDDRNIVPTSPPKNPPTKSTPATTKFPFVTRNSTKPTTWETMKTPQTTASTSTTSFITNSSPSSSTTTTTPTTTTTKPTTTTTTTTKPTTTTTTTERTTTPRTTWSTNRPIFINPSETTTEGAVNFTLDQKYVNGCGVAPLHPQMRIVGGKEALQGEFPWQVSVRRTSFFGFSSTHRCGGALLNSLWVATAGHCVDDLLTSQIRIRVGEHDFGKADDTLPSLERTVEKKVVHPQYNFFTYENDLALIKLERPVPLGPHIYPICLPGNDDLLVGEHATVTGWGRLSEGGQLPARLQNVQVPIMSNVKCREMFLKSGRVEHIPDIFLCAGWEEGGRDSCQGDSGGPLQVKGADGRWFLAGIISWGIGCAEPNMPGVCTRISKFQKWILKNVS